MANWNELERFSYFHSPSSDSPVPELGEIHINASKNLDGSRSVSRFDGADIGWTPIGRLQPAAGDVPKTQAQLIREAYSNRGEK